MFGENYCSEFFFFFFFFFLLFSGNRDDCSLRSV